MKTLLHLRFCFPAILLLSAGEVRASGAYHWIGGSGSWHDPLNWNLNMVPNSTGSYDDDAILTFSDTLDRVITGVGSAYQIHTGNAGTGRLFWDISEGSNFSHSGMGVTLGVGTILQLSGGGLTTDTPGAITIEAGATIYQTGGYIGGSGVLNNAGLWFLSGEASIGGNYPFRNSGTINQDGGHAYLNGGMGNEGIYNISGGHVEGHLLNSGELNLLGSGTRWLGGIANVGLIRASGTTYLDYIYGLNFSGDTVVNIQGTSGAVVFYDPSSELNDYLAGLTYNLLDGGHLMPIPEPSACALLGLGAGALILLARHGRSRRLTTEPSLKLIYEKAPNPDRGLLAGSAA